MRRASILVLAVGLAWQPAPAEVPATAPAGGKEPREAAPDRLAPFLDAIRQARHPSTAIAAYARANSIDRTSAELHDAYMKKMLRFGLPQIAYYAARTLVNLDGDSGTAWALIGYMEGRRENYAEAFSATVRATYRLLDDPSVQNNLGQLVAWYESVLDLPRVPDRDRRRLDAVRDRLFKEEAFQRAYQRIQGAYREQADLQKQFDQKISRAQGEVRTAQQALEAVRGQLRAVYDDLAAHRSTLEDLRREMLYAYAPYYYYRRYYPGPGGTIIVRPHYYPPYGSPYRQDLLARMRQEERTIDELEQSASALRYQEQNATTDLERKQMEMDQLRLLGQQATARLAKHFRWDPPAVDGLVTPELDAVPPGPARGPELPVDAEAYAAQRLGLARLYLLNDMDAKAVTILQDILSRYRDTAAAKEAREVLSQIPPKP